MRGFIFVRRFGSAAALLPGAPHPSTGDGSLVLGCRAEAMTEDAILAQYPTVTVAGIRAAAAYAAELTGEHILPLSGQ